MPNKPDDELTTLTDAVKRYLNKPPEVSAAYAEGFQDGFRQGVEKVFLLYADDPCTWPGFREWQRSIEEWRGSASLQPPYPPPAGSPGSHSDADEYDEGEDPHA